MGLEGPVQENPARVFGLYPRKGAIRVGADADLTMVRGQVVLNDGRLEQKPGYGRYLARTSPQPPVAGAGR